MGNSRGHRDYPVDEIEWRPGSREGIRYARYVMDPDDPASPVMIITKFQPGTEVAPHTHDCNYMELILEGEQTNGKDLLKKGDVRAVKGGTGYGPLVVGPDGCTVVALFQDGSRSMWEGLPRKKKVST